jgi:hypothetical protein
MTKENYIDEMIAYIARVDKTRRIHPRVIEAAINGAVNTVVSAVYEANPSDVTVYTYTYENVPVDGNKTYLTSDYTSSGDDIGIVHLPRVGGGVMSVRSSEEVDTLFFPMRIQDKVMYDRMQSSQFNTDVGFVVRGNVLEYVGLGTVTSVDVDIVRSFEEYGYEETFYIPFERQEDVKNLVLQKLGIPQPINLKNNNSDEFDRSQERSS